MLRVRLAPPPLSRWRRRRELAEGLRRRRQAIVDKVAAEGGTALEKYHIDHAEIEFSETTLGEGAFGTVIKAVFEGQTVAVKTVRATKVSERAVEDFRSCDLLALPARAVVPA